MHWIDNNSTAAVSDAEFYEYVYIIPGTLCPTRLPWLSVLSNILPSCLEDKREDY